MTQDDLATGIAADAMGALWANPVMRLSAISQAAANFAAVAAVAHKIGPHVEGCVQIRNVALGHIKVLLDTIKNEPTP